MPIKYIMVQSPEPCNPKSVAFKHGYATIADIGKERIRRAGEKIRRDMGVGLGLDIGFRVLKVDSPTKDEDGNIKSDRSAEDLLFQAMLILGLPLTNKITTCSVGGKTVFWSENLPRYRNRNSHGGPIDSIAACFDEGITDEVISFIADKQPDYAVFPERSFADEGARANAEDAIKKTSPKTTVKWM